MGWKSEMWYQKPESLNLKRKEKQPVKYIIWTLANVCAFTEMDNNW